MSLPQLLGDALAARDWAKVGEAYAVLTGSAWVSAAKPNAPAEPKAPAKPKSPAKPKGKPPAGPSRPHEPLPDQLVLPFADGDGGDALAAFRVAGVPAFAAAAAAPPGNAFDPAAYAGVEPPGPEELPARPTPRARAAAPDPVTVACDRCRRAFAVDPRDLARAGDGDGADADDRPMTVCPACAPHRG